MNSRIHPTIIIVLGILTVSILFNYLQYKENHMLRINNEQFEHMPLIIDTPNPYQLDQKLSKDNVI